MLPVSKTARDAGRERETDREREGVREGGGRGWRYAEHN